MQLKQSIDHAPFSSLILVWDEVGAVRAIEFGHHEARLHRLLRAHYGEYVLQPGEPPQSLVAALDAYFAGDHRAVDAIAVATGGTAFQRQVWQALRSIPPGTTKTYGQLARELGRASASRAVGAANGANPIAIVVPCHRVIGAQGALTGYSGGLAHKQWLLAHERIQASALRSDGQTLQFA
jgi:O-6-methylguanine DNA methyltransferase